MNIAKKKQIDNTTIDTCNNNLKEIIIEMKCTNHQGQQKRKKIDENLITNDDDDDKISNQFLFDFSLSISKPQSNLKYLIIISFGKQKFYFIFKF